MDNYPMGAANDPQAPYNEELDVTHVIEVSMCLDGALKIKAPKDTPFDELKQLAYLKSKEIAKDAGVILTNFDVVE